MNSRLYYSMYLRFCERLTLTMPLRMGQPRGRTMIGQIASTNKNRDDVQGGLPCQERHC